MDESIAQLEQAVIDAKKRLAEALRRRAPEVISNVTLRHAASAASVRLSELFGASRDLLIIHNMGKRCPYCTLWADGFSSLYKHLANRCAFALTTPDEPAEAAAFASARGWTFPVISHAGTEFASVLGYKGEDGQFGPFKPGVSGLRLTESGGAQRIERVAHRPFGPGDDFCSLWPLLELLADGNAGWAPKYHY